MQARRIHPGAYGALIEALASIYWYKKDLKKFIQTRAVEHPKLLVGLDFDGYKRAFAEEFVDRLMADEEQYRDLTLKIMLEVAQMDSFLSLKRHSDAATLLPAAQEAVAALGTWTDKYQGLVAEREALAAELAARRAQIEVQQGFAGKLAALKDQFMELGKMENRQKAGLLFEPFLNELFHLFDLEPRLSYVLKSEQIDGSLTFDTDDYIIEAKWWKGPVEVQDVDKFDAKVRRKGKNALGLFISVNGFTAGAREEYDKRTSFITMDGGDLFCVLEGRIALDELLRRKKRHANETGDCYFPAFLALAD
ncbi:restriction endonuclease [Streptomyces sp. SID12488]|uniref:restriction endonuclease n=1 Tax=Streptomyces sp. SID12488 TaxID=2706040 RepID=UPI0013DCAFFD|nr:restriction endonuclease [Streptomyces sp. SID12488]NEA65305.1 restriction endonuclease [Streptomyces sp. SID12488]